jgi:hypothetical protein
MFLGLVLTAKQRCKLCRGATLVVISGSKSCSQLASACAVKVSRSSANISMSRYELRSRTPAPTPAKKATARKSPVVLDEGSDSGEEEEHEVHEQHLGSPKVTAHVKAAVEKIEEAVPYDPFVSSYLPCTLIILAALATTYFYWHQFDVLIQLLEPLSVPAHANKHWSQGILPRVSILDFFGSIVVCDAYRKAAAFPKHPVETLVACTLLQVITLHMRQLLCRPRKQ